MISKKQTFIIAEAGVNHNGNLKLAKKLIDVASDAGANAIKFQTFRAKDLVSQKAAKADYQIKNTNPSETHFDMIRKLELSEKDHEILIVHAQKRGIQFLSSPFDMDSLHLLTKKFGLKTIKIPSGEITNAPFLLEVARASKQIILSTGMSTLEEIKIALGILAFGFIEKMGAKPNLNNFKKAFNSKMGQQALKDKVTLLHCTTEYPAPYGDVNLLAMEAMAKIFGLPVGYSDHTLGIHIALAAVARGATIVEKHFTLDRNMPGPDHKASLEPRELHQLVCQIREIEQAMGDGIKRPMASELKNREIARKSLVAAKVIQKGEFFSEENLACKRPGKGISPNAYWETLGKVAKRNYAADEALDV